MLAASVLAGIFHEGGGRRRKEIQSPATERHESNELWRVPIVAIVKSGMGLPHSTTSRMERHAGTSRQRRGVRQSYAAFQSSVRWQADSRGDRSNPPPYVGSYRLMGSTRGIVFCLLVLTSLTAISVCAADSQPSAKPGKSVATASAAKTPWSRIVMIGASASAGFTESEPLGGPATSQLRLNRYLDAALTTSHEPIRNLSSAMLFMQPEAQGQNQSERALQSNPTMVIALDFLFWFCYGDGPTDKDRLERFERGLKMLAPFQCPLILGDIPDASAAVERMLTADEIPSPAVLSVANRRLKEWASARKQTVVIPLSAFMRNATANKALTVHGHTFAEGKTRILLQEDKLHPSPAGCAVLALAIFDSFLASQPALSVGDIRWDPKEVYHLALDGPHASSPSAKSAEARIPATNK